MEIMNDSINNNEHGESSLDGGVKRACDQCRVRKVRCDKESPCSNCRTAQRICSSTGAGQRPKEARQRVLISAQYERKIDHFGARLTNIERMLRELTTSLSRNNNNNLVENAEQQQHRQLLQQPLATRTPGRPSPSSSSSVYVGSSFAGGLAYTPSPVTGSEHTGLPDNNNYNNNNNEYDNNSGIHDADADNDDDADDNNNDNDEDDDKDDDDDSGDDDLDSAFEGDSSLAAQTARASEFLEDAVSRTASSLAAGGAASASMQAALLSLKQIAALQRQRKAAAARESRFPHARPLPRGGVKELPIPPLPVVLGLLREIKEYTPITFTLVCAFIDVDSFIEACRRVYFATEDYSLATFIIVNIGLYYLFQEKAELAGRARASKLLEYHLLCRDNAETALSIIPMTWAPRMENIEALLLSASFAIEKSKFTMAWQFNSAAASMCISLGWHRLSPEPSSSPSSSVDSTTGTETPNANANNNSGGGIITTNRNITTTSTSTATNATTTTTSASADTRSALFWFAYMLDKGLALRFGRASAIQDWDVGNLKPRELGPAANVSTDRWRCVLNLWIRHAELMGATYEHLYSPRALARPLHERLASAHELIALLKGVAADSDEIARLCRAEAAVGRNSSSSNSGGGSGSGSKNGGSKGGGGGGGGSSSRNQKMGGGNRTTTATATATAMATATATVTATGGLFEEDMMEMVLKSDEVSYWSSMTLVYRAIPPSAPGFPSAVNAECIDAARKAFACHQHCIRLTEKSIFMQAGYLHWTIHFSPFIPFVSLFCHVIETSDAEDLARLADFVTSLQPAVSASEATEKLHRVCELLYNVARLYVEAKAQGSGGGDSSGNHSSNGGAAQQDGDADTTMAMVGSDFDMYLGQLGFMPPMFEGGGGGGGVGVPGSVVATTGAEFDNSAISMAATTAGLVTTQQQQQQHHQQQSSTSSAQLGDWFSGNRHILGLMEEDLSEFQPGLWGSVWPSVGETPGRRE